MYWKDDREFGLIITLLPDHGLRVEFDGKIYHFLWKEKKKTKWSCFRQACTGVVVFEYQFCRDIKETSKSGMCRCFSFELTGTLHNAVKLVKTCFFFFHAYVPTYLCKIISLLTRTFNTNFKQFVIFVFLTYPRGIRSPDDPNLLSKIFLKVSSAPSGTVPVS